MKKIVFALPVLLLVVLLVRGEKKYVDSGQPYAIYFGDTFSAEFPNGWEPHHDASDYVRFVKSTDPYVGIEVAFYEAESDSREPDGAYKTIVVTLGSKEYRVSLVIGGGIGGGVEVDDDTLRQLERDLEHVYRSITASPI